MLTLSYASLDGLSVTGGDRSAPNYVQDAHADATSELVRPSFFIAEMFPGHVVHVASAQEQLQWGPQPRFQRV
jgi:hypothetical protein